MSQSLTLPRGQWSPLSLMQTLQGLNLRLSFRVCEIPGSQSFQVTVNQRWFGPPVTTEAMATVRQALGLSGSSKRRSNGGAEAPEQPGDFGALVNRDPHVRLIRDALASPDRVHVLLHGPPAGGKDKLMACFPAAWRCTLPRCTTAGFISAAMEHADADLWVWNEIEKAPLGVLRAALGILDDLGAIERLVHGRVESVRTKVRVIAACNDIMLLRSKLSGSIFSRFGLALYCDSLDRASMATVLRRYVSGLSNQRADDTVELVLREFYDKLGIRDARRLRAVLSGGERLLTGTYIEDFCLANKLPYTRRLT